ncbi:MAG: amidohydrolase family protein, partial [Actinomycetota bacterium]
MSAIHITNARLIDGTGRAALESHDVVIDGDTIVSVGPHATITAPVSATVIDAHGATLMPGLIDAHCHITFDDV